jgi:hypothetical protein
MPAGMVPVNALFINPLITHPHDANAAKCKHEMKSVNVRTKVPRKQAHAHTQDCAQTQCAHAFTPARKHTLTCQLAPKTQGGAKHQG